MVLLPFVEVVMIMIMVAAVAVAGGDDADEASFPDNEGRRSSPRL